MQGDTKNAAKISSGRSCTEMELSPKNDNFTQQNHYQSPLEQASFYGEAEIVEMLNEKRADVLEGEIGNALIVALSMCQMEVAELLLCKYANKVQGAIGAVLGVVASYGYQEMEKLLLKKSTNVAHCDTDGALKLAAAHGYEDSVELLHKRRADDLARKLRNVAIRSSLNGLQKILEEAEPCPVYYGTFQQGYGTCDDGA